MEALHEIGHGLHSLRRESCFTVVCTSLWKAGLEEVGEPGLVTITRASAPTSRPSICSIRSALCSLAVGVRKCWKVQILRFPWVIFLVLNFLMG